MGLGVFSGLFWCLGLFSGFGGLFTFREKGRIETGAAIGEWTIIDQTPVFFQPRGWLVGKSYARDDARSISEYARAKVEPTIVGGRVR